MSEIEKRVAEAIGSVPCGDVLSREFRLIAARAAIEATCRRTDEKEFVTLEELLSACHSMLDGAENSSDQNSPLRQNWLESRDALLKQIELALFNIAEEHPY